ncbi:MAG: class I SAM-dependent methyltransferase [Bacteroidales bacterium]|nr:class I SAM-dependent methyltransferase [Bacteroidales bacterium]
MMIDYLTYFFLVLAIALIIWYLYGWLWGNEGQNEQWKIAVKHGKVSVELQRYYRRYPDKQRFVLFWLQAQHLQTAAEDAVVAELGVYQGDTARLIELLFPRHELFLFDTFEGFQEKHLALESGEAATYTSGHFADTSLARVQERLLPGGKVRFFKGDFATTSIELPERSYAFVSIDVDLGQPTKAGLEYFYPRLIPGGVIIIHDYHPKWPTLMQAVDNFLNTIPEEGVLMPDRNNSMVIVKNKTTPIASQ